MKFGKKVTEISDATYVGVNRNGRLDVSRSGFCIRHIEKCHFRSTTHTYQVSYDGGETWSNISREKFNELHESVRSRRLN